MIDDGTMAIRLIMAAVLGGAVGVEREFRDQPAGLRTHMLVGLGSCLFTLMSLYGFTIFLDQPGPTTVRSDLSRVASQVVVGIGFIGGGAILKGRGTIRGLTTAANLWVTAAIGLAVGAGFYLPAAVTAGIALFSLAVLRPIERRLFWQRGKGSKGGREKETEQESEEDAGDFGSGDFGSGSGSSKSGEGSESR